jgi:DNA-binding NtrC family response regulator
MPTIALIDPSPTDRAALAAALRADFTVLENGTLTPDAAITARLVVATADAVTPHRLARPPFASLPCLVLGRFSTSSAERPAPIHVLEAPVDPSEVASHVHRLLRAHSERARPPARRTTLFFPPALRTTVEQAAQAHRAQLPILIVGERGTGKRTLVRTLHEQAGYGTLLRVTPLTADTLRHGRARKELAASDGAVTLFADAVDAFSGDAQALLADCLSAGTLEPAGARRPFWLVATTSGDLRVLAETGRFDAALAARLTETVVEVPPLRSRGDSIIDIAQAVLGELSSTLGQLTLTTEAQAAIQAHPWPGNLTELMAALRRAAVLTAGTLISARDLGLEAAVPPVAMPSPPTATWTAAPGRAGNGRTQPPPPAPPQLELILTELAHELKNPMVTIKTFAQHLPSLLEDAELRDRFAGLTDDAISRMDGVIENVLDFARLGPPQPGPVALTALLDRSIEAIADVITTRGARIRREGWEHAPRVVADELHLTYAMRNLLDSVAPELPRDHELAVHVEDDGTFDLRFMGATGVTAKLQSFLSNDLELPGPAALPLRFMLARSVITRNGGELEVNAVGPNETVVTVALPPASKNGGG